MQNAPATDCIHRLQTCRMSSVMALMNFINYCQSTGNIQIGHGVTWAHHGSIIASHALMIIHDSRPDAKSHGHRLIFI